MPDDIKAPGLDKLAPTARARVEAAILSDIQRELGRLDAAGSFSKVVFSKDAQLTAIPPESLAAIAGMDDAKFKTLAKRLAGLTESGK